MNKKSILKLVKKLKNSKITDKEFIEKLKFLPFEPLGEFVKIDHHRELRTSHPEVIYCQGKEEEYILKIIQRLLKTKKKIFATKVENHIFKKLKEEYSNLRYNKLAKTLITLPKKKCRKNLVCLITAGTSDISVAEEAFEVMLTFSIEALKLYDVGIAGLHRLLEYRKKISKCKVLIVVAGMEGALPGIVAGMFGKPTIGVPTSIGYGTSFKGVAPLLTMLNSCAPGITVVNIDNGFGAGYMAGLICESFTGK